MSGGDTLTTGSPGESPALAPTEADPRGDVALEPGHRIGRHLVLGRLGAGGMGVVFAAYDPELDRKVAIKLMRPGRGADSPARQERLLREAQAMAKLAHPNVIVVHDVGTAGESVYFAMELCDGGTLREWLCEPRPWREVLEVFLRAGQGLAAAHAAGLVHRDFKPDNVLLGKDGRARVTDFGLALPVDSGPPGHAVGRWAAHRGRRDRRHARVHGAGAELGRARRRARRSVQLLRRAPRGALRRPALRGQRAGSAASPAPRRPRPLTAVEGAGARAGGRSRRAFPQHRRALRRARPLAVAAPAADRGRARRGGAERGGARLAVRRGAVRRRRSQAARRLGRAAP
jgi:hypothetical protein